MAVTKVIPVFLTTFVAFISACCLLLVACSLFIRSNRSIVQSFTISGRGESMPMLDNGKELPRWIALGIVTACMNNVYTLGLRWTTATNCAIFIATTPLWTYLGAICFGMEVLDRRWKCRAVGFLLAVMGALVVSLGRAQSAIHMGQSKFFRVFGNIVVLFAVCSMSAYYLLVRSLASNHSPLQITLVAQAAAFCYSAVFIVMALAAEEEAPGASWASVAAKIDFNIDVVYAALYAGIAINVVCFGIEAWALRHASPGTVALFTALDPPFTACLSVIFLHETASFSLVVGGMLIVSGLFVNAGVEEYALKFTMMALELEQEGESRRLEDTNTMHGDEDDNDNEEKRLLLPTNYA